MADSSLVNIIREQAGPLNLDVPTICAMVEQESAWNPWAIRYEPAFYSKYIVPLHLSATESTARSISWGLLQLMGQCAREHGYTSDLSKLCDPAVGLKWGIIHWQSKLQLAKGNVSAALLFWNGGGNKAYASEVLARVNKYK